MDDFPNAAPPVVAVVVVHQPGSWLDEVLDGIAEQDYPNLRSLFLVVGQPGDIPERIRQRVPGAFVRGVDGNHGFGHAANHVLNLVEGDNGFFCFLHDDVALQANAIRLLVEEVFRSNAGIVGPKLVQWDDPGVLQHVGFDVDRFGEIDPLIEPGELDQEQHDAVRDVFALPTACLMVRADLFRELGGFAPSIDFHGDDVDLCWRAHLSGARVIVVPPAVARHRERLEARRPDLAHEQRRARHRIRTVATLTSTRRLPARLLQVLALSVIELIVGVFTGRVREGAASLRALSGLVTGAPAIAARRREVAALRQVPDGEVVGLQTRGSARLSTYLRHRDNRRVESDVLSERRWRQAAGSAPAVAWVLVLVAIALGSRHLFRSGVPAIGDFLPYPDRARGLLGDVRSGWVGQGLGNSESAPLGLALIGLASVATLFNMGLLHTLGIVGLLVVGARGMWSLCSLFPTVRARVTGLAVYTAVPLPSQLLSVGRWGALACYAAMPWLVHLARRVVGVSRDVEGDGEADVSVARRSRLRDVARLVLLCGLVVAFSPGFAFVAAVAGVVLGATTLLGGGSPRSAVSFVAAGLGSAVGGLLLNLPWSMSLADDGAWTGVVGVPPAGATSRGLGELAAFDLGLGRYAALALLLYLPVVASVALARGWRHTWAVRAAGLVVVFGWLALLDDRGSLPVRLPEPGVLLAPVALGVALAAACLVAAIDVDILGGAFGWRQPLGVLAIGAVGIGVLPGIYATFDGRWNMPEQTISSALVQLQQEPAEGDYRVLWLGDPRVMPVGAWTLRPGIAYGISQDGPLSVRDRFVGAPSDAERAIAEALELMVGDQANGAGSTQHVGRLLAPFAIRFIVLPATDGALSTVEDPIEPAEGLIASLDRQLDLSQPLTRPLSLIVYENTEWLPTRSTLTEGAAATSRSASPDDLTRTALAGATPFAAGASDRGPMAGPVEPGVLHVAVPFDEGWSLQVDGSTIAPRPAFGSTMAFDVPAGGTGELRYDTPTSRLAILAAMAVVWLALLVLASRLEWHRVMGRFRRRTAVAGPIAIDLGPGTLPPMRRSVKVPWAGEDVDSDLAVADAGTVQVDGNQVDGAEVDDVAVDDVAVESVDVQGVAVADDLDGEEDPW